MSAKRGTRKGNDPTLALRSEPSKPSGRSRTSYKTSSLSRRTAFLFFLLPHILAAFHSPIQDCDEVFNYWEPTHYLNHGYGLQTWEYSPVYAIRSWGYAGTHAALITPMKFLAPYFGGKSAEFLFLRIVLGLVCAGCETRLFQTIARTMSPRIALIFMLIMTTSSGMFHAATSYLPSTFAMYSTMLGVAAFMDWRGGLRTAQGIFWFGVGGIMGWPFAAALVLPFMLEELLIASLSHQLFEFIQRSLNGSVRSLIVLALQTSVDVFFYRKLVCVPWNIVAYNIFAGSSKGPNIYGTEPWHYYFRNLLLNFNIWLPLALSTTPFIFIQTLVRKQAVSSQSLLRSLTTSTPFYLWLAIFTLQPHKEERFMYPAYPLLALNAAISLHSLFQIVGHLGSKSSVLRIPPLIKAVAATGLIIFAITISLLRTAGLATGYTAPLKVYSPLQQHSRSGDTVCLGKEWYRFPSSYFLPDGVKAKFIKSAFAGLLPGEFSEANTGFGLFPGAWLEPSGMNDENKEDIGKYINVSHCNYLVDSYFQSAEPSELEPNYVLDTEMWDRLACEPFLDTGATGTLGRMIWLPEWDIIPQKFKRKWGEYCLLKRKN